MIRPRLRAPTGYLLPFDAAEYLAMSNSGLAKMRMAGTGPAFYKPTPNMVLYKKEDLDAWIERSKRNEP